MSQIIVNDPVVESYSIGPDSAPFIIAEVSCNHNGDINRAFEIIEAAAKAGAHSVKFQTYTADTMTLDINEGEFAITDEKSLWTGYNLYKLYQEAYTPWEWHKALFDKVREFGMIPLSTPFDATAVDFLEKEVNPGIYKIASFENTDIPLIEKVAKTGKPMIISTGMATSEELEETVTAAKNAGCKELILLQCTSAYPSDAEDANLATMADMRERFGVQIGLSDHTLGLAVPLVSVAMGATVIEKHFMLRRADGGHDSAFSLEPKELEDLVVESKRAWQAIGKVSYGPSSPKEEKSLVYRRSLYIVEDVKAGDTLTEENVRAIRPGLGLKPKYMKELLGKVATADLKRGTALKHEHYK